MRIYIAGNGKREECLKAMLQKKGHLLVEQGFDAAVLEIPFSACDTELQSRFREGQHVICGKTEEPFERIVREKKWQLHRVLQDDTYIQKNAVLSAEGAVFAAMKQADFALNGTACLVIGYGRIGKALTEMLRGLGAKVTVAARRKESREEAGEGSIPMEKIGEILPKFQIVFNTVPSPVLTFDQLKKADPNTLFLELASSPYGIDFQAASALGLHATLESGIPGRYCPCSAAEIMVEYIERSVPQNE